jgi:hypothetical protein
LFVVPLRIPPENGFLLSPLMSFSPSGRFCQLLIPGPCEAFGAETPVDDLGLVYREALGVLRDETRRSADGAVDVGGPAADATDRMVVVVADAGLETRRRAGGLDPPDEAFRDKQTERVVDRLLRDRSDLGPDDLGHAIDGCVRVARDRPKNGQSLRRYLNAAHAKELGRFAVHVVSIIQQVESINN